MGLSDHAARAIKVINGRLAQLDTILAVRDAPGADDSGLRYRLEWWRSATCDALRKQVGQGTPDNLPGIFAGAGTSERDGDACRAYLEALRDTILDDPDYVLSVPREEEVPRAARAPGTAVDERTVFIAYGKDVPNAQALERLLETEWKLTPKLLSREAGGGRHLMEALEDEAGRAGYAFVIMTPDDHVANEDEEPYRQARPNVMLELGWLYGKLGRSRVCILLKKGTRLPSDVHGIKYVEFAERVNESYEGIRAELRRAEVIQDRG